jgi:hypothetical protein
VDVADFQLFGRTGGSQRCYDEDNDCVSGPHFFLSGRSLRATHLFID